MNAIDTAKFRQEIKSEVNEMMQVKIITPINPQGYQAYLDTGNRLRFEEQYFARRRQLAVLGLELLLETPRSESIEMLEAVIWEICNEYTWALPAHLEILSDGRFAEDSPLCIDLFAAETAQALTEILEIHREYLSPLIQARIHQEVEKRIFSSLDAKVWHWEFLENNWSAVIAGCIGMAALSLLDKNSVQQQRLLKRLEKSFQSYLNGFAADGACEEGVSYWAYGFGYYLYFAEKYQQVHGDSRYLALPQLQEIAAFPERVRIGRNRYVPFSDASETEELPSGLLSFCHHTFRVPVPPVTAAPSLHFDHCYRWAHLYRNIIWTAPIANKVGDGWYYFPNVQWIVAKGRGNFVFAAKGGRNNESHNHNDMGHFVIGVEDELLLTDLGAGEYTREYFQEHSRYHILNNRSGGHSVPLINQHEQIAGDVGAKQVALAKTDAGFTFAMELGDVYPEAAGVASFRRVWEISITEKRVWLRDEIVFRHQANHQIQLHLISTVKPTRNAKAVYWKGEKGILRMGIPPLVDTVLITEEEIKNHRGNTETVYITVLLVSCQKEFKREYEFSIVESKGDRKDGI